MYWTRSGSEDCDGLGENKNCCLYVAIMVANVVGKRVFGKSRLEWEDIVKGEIMNRRERMNSRQEELERI